MPVIRELLDVAIIQLTPVANGQAINEALILLSYATGRQIASLRLDPLCEITRKQADIFHIAVQQRVKFQPVAQIVGHRAFWKHEFIVTQDVLDPRPDTETLIEHATCVKNVKKILDIGTGSGCILLSLLTEFPDAIGVGTDVSKAALDVAVQNANLLGLASRSGFIQSNWCDRIDETFDLLVSNPPYISASEMSSLSRDILEWEPHMALTPGGDGLDAYRAIISDAPRVLNPGGHILFEIGFDQSELVSQLLELSGFIDIKTIQDINNKNRVVSAKMA